MGECGWDDLVKIAVLGTARLAARLEVGTAGAGPSAERGVLRAAASQAVARKAAREPVGGVELPAPAPVLDGRPMPGDVIAVIPRLFADGLRPVLVEVVERAAALDMRWPPSTLPDLLDAASAGGSSAALKVAAAGAAGARGRWLAHRNPQWSWVEPVRPGNDAGAVWDLAGTGDRVALLQRLRRDDPGAAVSLMERTWRSDRAAERARFVATLRESLSMDDEPFLEETGLADRAREVREATWRLLDALPESRRASRMAERADEVMAVLGSPATFEPPTAWAGDGVETRRGKGSLAAGLIAATPLDHWGRDIPLAIGRVEAAAPTSDGLVPALRRAAIDQRRDDWIVALLGRSSDNRSHVELLRAASGPAVAAWLAGVLTKASAHAVPGALGLTHAVPRPWPAALVAEVLRRSVEVLTHERRTPADLTVHLHLVGERAAPHLLARLVPDLAAIRSHDVRLERAFRGAHTVAALRHQILSALEPGAREPGAASVGA